MPKTFVLFCVILILACGCNVGNRYGSATGESTVEYKEPNNFELRVHNFLEGQLRDCGGGEAKIDRLMSKENAVKYKITGKHGCVTPDNRWEILDITVFSSPTSDKKYDQIIVMVEGWTTAAHNQPLESQFTTSMERAYPGELHNFASHLASEYRAIQNSGA